MDYFNNYSRKCKDTQGGIVKAYLTPYVEYDESIIKSVGMQLTAFPATVVYEFECRGNYTQTSEFDKGNVSWNQSVNLQLSKAYDVLDINAFLRNDWRVIALTNNQQLIIFGVDNGLVCTSNNNSGNEKAEFNGFDLTFTGKEEKTGLLVGELSDFFPIFNDGDLFSYDLNFDIINYE